jgi:hypothetical protein
MGFEMREEGEGVQPGSVVMSLAFVSLYFAAVAVRKGEISCVLRSWGYDS